MKIDLLSLTLSNPT